MSIVKVSGNASGTGTLTIAAPNTNSDFTLTLPTATGTVLSNADIATQANQETATSTATLVTPGRQQFHPSATKFWVNATNSGGINASYNVASITDGGTGLVTVTYTTAFSGVSYCTQGTPYDSSGGVRNVKCTSQTTTTSVWACYGETPALVDPNTAWLLSGNGDQ